MGDATGEDASCDSNSCKKNMFEVPPVGHGRNQRHKSSAALRWRGRQGRWRRWWWWRCDDGGAFVHHHRVVQCRILSFNRQSLHFYAKVQVVVNGFQTARDDILRLFNRGWYRSTTGRRIFILEHGHILVQRR